MIRFASLALLALLALVPPAAAQVPADIVKVRILPGWRNDQGQHITALQVTMKDGWKTYWRAPGETGVAPQFDWRRSRNLARADVVWPTPSVIHAYGLKVIGYQHELVLPLVLTPEQPGAITFAGTARLGICKDICTEKKFDFSVALPDADTGHDPRITAALQDRPASGTAAGLDRAICKVTPAEGGMRIDVTLDMPPLGAAETAVIESDNPALWISTPETRRENGRLHASSEVYHVNGDAFAMNRAGVIITVLGDGKATEFKGCSAS